MNPVIRKEEPTDYPVVYKLVQAAFEHAEHTDHDEQNFVERLRRSTAFIPELSLVAEMDGRIVGHIMLTTLKVGEHAALAVAPLSVIPDMQGKGIGSLLMKAAHQRAKALGHRFCILLGHADYYPRFGYKPADSFGIRSPFDVPAEEFMACNLQGDATRLEGIVECPSAFFETGKEG